MYSGKNNKKSNIKAVVFERVIYSVSDNERVSVKIESSPLSLINWVVTESISFHLNFYHERGSVYSSHLRSRFWRQNAQVQIPFFHLAFCVTGQVMFQFLL